MITIYINNIKIQVKKNITILQACEQLNIEIPRFCFHENLQIAGNCRMCLVEIKNSIKPVVSCAMPVMENMEIFTNTPFIKKSRESVLEFLLLNHPLDCPICDQGGECDLQDQTYSFGTDKSRFFEWKRGVEDKNCGPFIKTIMTRCIHCTRCVRFSNEICESDVFGTLGRGNKTEISFYLDNIFFSEFSGNIIDLCPVGALLSKPFSFRNRSWELKKEYQINLFDSFSSPLEIHLTQNEIVRILPKMNKTFDISWITNKTRFFFDSLKYQRLMFPLLKKNNKFITISWEYAFNVLKLKMYSKDCSNLQVIFGNLTDLESLYYLKKIINNFGSNCISYQNFSNKFSKDFSNKFLISFKYIKKSDLYLLINCNLKVKSPILNLYLKKKKKFIYVINLKYNLSYSYNLLSNKKNTLFSILEGKHFFCKNIIKSKNPLFFFNKNFENLSDNILENYIFLKKIIKIKIYNQISLLNSFEMNMETKNYYNKSKTLLYLYNTDIHEQKINFNINKQFIIYQGHHFNEDAQNSNLILPGLTIFEKSQIFFNFEGFIFNNKKILELKHNQKNDKKIFQHLFYFFNFKFYKIYSFYKLMPYLKSKKLNISNIKIKYNFRKLYFLDFDNYLNINNNFSNILEKYSKILNNSLKFFNTYSNFK